MRNRLLALLIGVVLVATAACGGGGGDSGGESGGGSSGDTADAGAPSGVARLGYDLLAARRGGMTLDPSKSTSTTTDIGLYHWIYGGLMRPDPDGTLVPDLAESVTFPDPNTIEVTLHSEMTLPDGRPFDATLVKDALDRNLALRGQPNLRAFGADFFKLSSVEAVNPTTLRLTIPDGTAAGWADRFLGSPETVIVPPGTDFTKPTGAGPFQVVEFVPETRMVLEANPDYWDAESIKVQRIELINVPDAQAGVAALNAGQVDWARIDISTIDAAGAGVEVVTTPDPNFLTQVRMCKANEPFSDPKVRQALSMAIDRDAVNQALFKGLGQPASDLWPEDHRFHNPDTDDLSVYDPDAAKELLEDAGYPDGFTFDLMPHSTGGMPELAQIIQQQLAEIGVTANIVTTTNYVQDFDINHKAPVAVTPTGGGQGLAKLQYWVGDNVINTCAYNDADLNALTQQVNTVSSDSDEAADLWHEIGETVAGDTLGIFLVFQPKLTAYNPDRLNDVPAAYYTIIVPEVRDLVATG